jgi:hypothetical protein
MAGLVSYEVDLAHGISRFQVCLGISSIGSLVSASAGGAGFSGSFAIARLHFGEIHHRACDVVYVVREDVKRDVGDGLDDVAVGQAEGACLLEVGVADFAALQQDTAREFENSVGLLGRGPGMPRVSDIFLREADFATDERVGAEAVAAQVALGDSKGDLFTDLGVEAASGERAAEVQIALERRGSSAEHAEKVRHDA